MAERVKPVKEQRGALQCSKYQKWFCSRGALAVHKCRVSREPLTETPAKMRTQLYFELRKELQVFLTSKTSAHGEFFSNVHWLVKLAYLSINKLVASM